MARLSSRVQRAGLTIRTRAGAGGVSTGSGFSSAQGGAGTNAPSIGQPVKVKTGYLWLSGNHGLEAFAGNTIRPSGVWNSTQGAVQSIRGDKILVSLKTNFSSRHPEFWVRQSIFWSLFEPA